MDREILFRGKRIDNGKWAYGYLETEKIIAFTTPLGNFEEVFVDPSSVCQYTGMVDCNCNKVFEGDVVSFRGEDGLECKGEVVFGYFRFGIRENPINDCFPLECTEYNSVEIMGNIYDNPELSA